jgi:hypothetical protein
MSATETSGPLYIVHPDPVERRDTNYIAHVDLAPLGLAGQLEQVWLHDLATAGTHWLVFRSWSTAWPLATWSA